MLADGPGPLYQYFSGKHARARGLRSLRVAATATRPDAAAMEDACRKLADLDTSSSTLARALAAEYTAGADAVDAEVAAGGVTQDPSFPAQPASYRFHPNATKRLAQGDFRRMIEDATLPLRERRPTLTEEEYLRSTTGWLARMQPNLVGRRVYGQLVGTIAVMSRGAARDAADLRATRVALALTAHRLRTGALPSRLDELSALGAIPCDPFDGAPIRYDASRRLVWVLGTDLTDDGGTATPCDGVEEVRWKSPDPGWQLPD